MIRLGTAAGILLIAIGFSVARADETEEFRRVSFNHAGLTADLGVGLNAWPLPMDYDGDGDLDLVVSCPDVPYGGTYFFENSDATATMPIFKPAVRIGEGQDNIQVSYLDGKPRVLGPGVEYVDFLKSQYTDKRPLPIPGNFHGEGVRGNQWKYVDYDDDGRLDLIIGIGDWKEYGWDNAFNEKGEWTRGPLHGFVYLARNTGTNEKPEYATPIKLTVGDQAIDVYGMPSPNLADFDGDGDLDLLCGEFVDKFTYFENVGTRAKPIFREGRFLENDSQPLQVDLCMIVPVAIDWDHDGDVDLVVGQEDGRVMLIEHTGRVTDGLPQFEKPQFFRQQATAVKFGALATPVSFDWDNDGDEDLVCGNTAGQIGFIENLDGGNPPKWATPQLLEVDGQEILIQAGENGSIQGPCEAKWGYTTLSVADWDHDALPDLIVNSILGKVVWYRNVGTRASPRLAAAQPIEVEWLGKTPKPAWNWWQPKGKSLATQWRTTPSVLDFNGDKLNDLVMLDQEGYLAFFERVRQDGRLVLLPPVRNFVDEDGKPLRLAGGTAGGSGRRKFCFVDWDQDGRLDLLVNGVNIRFLRSQGQQNGKYVFSDEGTVSERKLAGHSTSPTVVDWNKNGVPDLLVGAEDGFFYFLRNPHE